MTECYFIAPLVQIKEPENFLARLLVLELKLDNALLMGNLN